uniref:Small integral membrane protein 5 n=1 Tax=Salvator merianae TaxID=96440 RepID=A0A8D0EET2_SALMN
MSYKDFLNELCAVGEKLWLKLQKLPKAEPLEIVFFFIIILFIATILSMMIIACTFCCTRCCSGSPAHKTRRIQVQPAAQA